MNILVAESEPVTQALIAGALVSWGHRVDVVTDLDMAWAALSHPAAARMAVVAAELEDGATDSLLTRLRAQQATRSIWVLQRLRPGTDRGHAGADDVLPMPFELSTLRSRLRIGSRALALTTELAVARERLAQLARVDDLTGVASRVAVLDALERELARRERGLGVLSVIIADLDGFRRVNEAFGAGAGDAALREAASRIVMGVRRYDVVGRSGGKEFLVVLPGCDEAGAMLLAERLRQRIRTRALTTPAGPVALTSSVGVATVAAGDDGDALLVRASSALAAAKRGGGDRVCGG